jgi:hypothetical protein
MKNRKQSKKLKTKARAKHNRPSDEAPSTVFTTIPVGPPLEGRALEQKVAEVLCQRFRKTAERTSLRRKCQSAGHEAIEAAIVSPGVQNIVEPVTQAFALEQTIAVIRLLLCNARAALESEKPTSAQVTALKIVFETLAEKMLARIGGGLWKESAGLFAFSDYEKCLIENLLQTVRGQRTPVAEGPQRVPDFDQNHEKGD